MSFERAIVISSETRSEKLKARFNTIGQAKFYIEQAGGNFKEYQTEHSNYQRSIDVLLRQLSSTIKYKVINRSFLPNYIFSENDLIIVVGQDGLVANTAKYVNGLPILAVNPDPNRYDGVLLPFNTSNFQATLRNVLQKNYQTKAITMARVRLNDGQELLAFNDFFIGPQAHTSARYTITFEGQQEVHSSSGIIVSTGAGATGWLSSLFNMAHGMIRAFSSQEAQGHFTDPHTGRHVEINQFDPHTGRYIANKSISPHFFLSPPQLTWDADKLVFVVREPFVSKTSQAYITAGIIEQSSELILESNMPEKGIIFSDGITSDFLQFNSGAIAHIGIAPQKAQLIVA